MIASEVSSQSLNDRGQVLAALNSSESGIASQEASNAPVMSHIANSLHTARTRTSMDSIALVVDKKRFRITTLVLV